MPETAMRRIHIEAVRSEPQAARVRALAMAFVAWQKARYPEREEQIRTYLRAQDFEGQLENLLEVFAPPSGECLLAWVDDAPVGIVMLKPRKDGHAELNRMFVMPNARGLGVGRALCQAIIERAKSLGYREVLLAALPRHHEALALYRSLGFVDDVRTDEGSPADAVSMRKLLA